MRLGNDQPEQTTSPESLEAFDGIFHAVQDALDTKATDMSKDALHDKLSQVHRIVAKLDLERSRTFSTLWEAVGKLPSKRTLEARENVRAAQNVPFEPKDATVATPAPKPAEPQKRKKRLGIKPPKEPEDEKKSPNDRQIALPTMTEKNTERMILHLRRRLLALPAEIEDILAPLWRVSSSISQKRVVVEIGEKKPGLAVDVANALVVMGMLTKDDVQSILDTLQIKI